MTSTEIWEKWQQEHPDFDDVLHLTLIFDAFRAGMEHAFKIMQEGKV